MVLFYWKHRGDKIGYNFLAKKMLKLASKYHVVKH
jgi:hypothetical protein